MIQTQAYVLGYQPHGEADRFYTLLTEELGKIEAYARSVRKVRARLAGHLEPPNLVWGMLVESHRGGRQSWQITQALESETYRQVRSDPELVRAIFNGALLLNNFFPPDMPDPVVWELWQGYVRALSQNAEGNAGDPQFLFSQFVCRALQHFGFFPDLASMQGISYRTQQVFPVIFQGVWLPKSTQSEEIGRLAEAALREARRHMI